MNAMRLSDDAISIAVMAIGGALILGAVILWAITPGG